MPILHNVFTCIQVFDMDALKSIYEQELVNDEGYKKEHDLFAQINGDNGLHGLSFINKIEANHFNGKIEERLSKRISKEYLSKTSNQVRGADIVARASVVSRSRVEGGR